MSPVMMGCLDLTFLELSFMQLLKIIDTDKPF